MTIATSNTVTVTEIVPITVCITLTVTSCTYHCIHIPNPKPKVVLKLVVYRKIHVPIHSRRVVTPLCMRLDPQNWPCEPVNLFYRLGRVGLAVPSRSHTTVNTSSIPGSSLKKLTNPNPNPTHHCIHNPNRN